MASACRVFLLLAAVVLFACLLGGTDAQNMLEWNGLQQSGFPPNSMPTISDPSSVIASQLNIQTPEPSPTPMDAETEKLQADYFSEKTEGKKVPALCTTPKFYDDSIKSWTGWNSRHHPSQFYIANQIQGRKDLYKSPSDAFRTEEEAADFIKTVYARTPFFLPHEADDVHLVSSWYSDDESFMGSSIYAKRSSNANSLEGDLSFEVRAIAKGRVVSAYWSDWIGNSVVIQHRAPDGFEYRSVYTSLSNGKSNDLRRARAVVPAKDCNSCRRNRYIQFAESNSNAALWGSEDSLMKVKAGDWVISRQPIGTAGATGVGSLYPNETTPATRLTMFIAVKHPMEESWILVDPYGVYSHISTQCYGMQSGTQFKRLYAPFYNNFHNVPYSDFDFYKDYYANMGGALQTISLYYDEQNRLMVAGSFQRGLGEDWRAVIFQTTAGWTLSHETFLKEGFVPRQITVNIDHDGVPRITCLYKKQTGEIHFWIHYSLTEDNFAATLRERTQNGYRVRDHFVYVKDGTVFHAVIFVRYKNYIGPQTVTWWQTSPEFKQTFKRQVILKLVPVSMSVFSDGTDASLRVSAVYEKRIGNWYAFYNLSVPTFIQMMESLSKTHYRVHRLQMYANGAKVMVIFKRMYH